MKKPYILELQSGPYKDRWILLEQFSTINMIVRQSSDKNRHTHMVTVEDLWEQQEPQSVTSQQSNIVGPHCH